MATNLVKLVGNLQQRKARRRRKLTVIEGLRLVEDALESGVSIRGALISRSLSTSPRGSMLLGQLASHAVPLDEIDERTLSSLADTETPQGVIAVIEPPRFELNAIRPGPRAPVVVLDGVQDPGNVGALLRSAFALGAAGAVLLTGTADATNPKVVRAAMGASFRFAVASAGVDEFVSLATRNHWEVWISDARGVPIGSVRRPDQLVLVFGNESSGVSERVAELARRRVAIPLARGAESLNVAVAGGIILYEVQRAH